MDLSPAGFILFFLILSGIGWLLFTFTARLLSFFLGRMISAAVQFRFGGINCLRDITINFRKGSIESLTIGELKLSVRREYVGLGDGVGTKFPRLHVQFLDVDLITRKTNKETSKKEHRPKKSSSSRGKWMLFVSVAKYLTVSLQELVVQMPMWTMEIKELDVSMYSQEASPSHLGARLLLVAFKIFRRDETLQIAEPRIHILRQRLPFVGDCGKQVEQIPHCFFLEQLLMTSVVDHEREKGITVKHVDIDCGEVDVNVNEDLVQMKKNPSKVSEQPGLTQGMLAKEALQDVSKPKMESRPRASWMAKIPAKASFSLLKLHVKCCHLGSGIVIENEVSGISLKSNQVQCSEEAGDTGSRLDILMDWGECKILRETNRSLVEIMKLAVAVSLEIPKLLDNPLQAEIDVKLGGAQCNLMMNKFERWLCLLDFASKQNKENNIAPSGETSPVIEKKVQPRRQRKISWTCTLSAPELSVMAYNLNEVALYNACFQTAHIFMNSTPLSQGVGVHTELKEMHVSIIDEDHKYFKETVFGVDMIPGCLMQISQVTVDWGEADMESAEDQSHPKKMAVSVEFNSSALYLTIERMERLIYYAWTLANHLKDVLALKLVRKPKTSVSTKPVRKRNQKVVFICSLENFSVQFCEQMHVSEVNVKDPKRVNFGGERGAVLITENDDGKPRIAHIKPTSYNGMHGVGLKCKTSLELSYLNLRVDKDKGSTNLELQRAKVNYLELGQDDGVITDITLLALRSGKVIHQTTVLAKGKASRSLVHLSEFTMRWEPDIHLFMHDTTLRMKSGFQKLKENINSNRRTNQDHKQSKEVGSHKVNSTDSARKKGQHNWVVAIDAEKVSVAAAVGDGVELLLFVQSAFSEDIRVGMLSEGMRLSINGATVVDSESLQIARLPSTLDNPSVTSSEFPSAPKKKVWDYLIQSSGLRIILPFRFPFRAIEDSVEDMWRGLKLAIDAQKYKFSSASSKSGDSKIRKESVSSLGSVKIVTSCASFEIEEEPLQGWFDEHHRLIQKHACELAIRERLLEEVFVEGGSLSSSQHTQPNNVEILQGVLPSVVEEKDTDLSKSSVQKDLKMKLHQQAFQAYRKACQNLPAYEGSGSLRTAMQKGFRPSVNRGHLFIVRAENLELTLTDIPGGQAGVIERIRNLDSVSADLAIPFSKTYSQHVQVAFVSLVVQLRNFTVPLLSAGNGKCEGDVILARQATCLAKQISQEIYLGRWRKLEMLRSQSGTTPPCKIYSNLPLHFERTEIGYGVGFEPALTDLSYVFTIALRRANLSVHDLVKNKANSVETLDRWRTEMPSETTATDIQPEKKERSLPWWDEMRSYIHGKNSIISSNFRLVLLATSDPYEEKDKMEFVADLMEIRQSEGRVNLIGKEFNVLITSLEKIRKNQGIKQVPEGALQTFIHSPHFELDITMDWQCDSGQPLFHYLFALPNEAKTREKLFDPFRSTSVAFGMTFCLSDCSYTDDFSGSGVDSEGLNNKSKPSSILPSKRVSVAKSVKDSMLPSPLEKLEGKYSKQPPKMNLCAQDLIWILKWWSMIYSPPNKIRTFSKWRRFSVPRVPRSGNLSFDKVLTEFVLKVSATPVQIKHRSLLKEDPAEGLTFNSNKLKYEICYSRGQEHYTFECKRDLLELVYQGLDLHSLKAELKRDESVYMTKQVFQQGSPDAVGHDSSQDVRLLTKMADHGFLLSSEYISMRRQAPKAHAIRLSTWCKEGRWSQSNNASGESNFMHESGSDQTKSEPSDDDSFNVVLPDNCLRVSLYCLKLLWTLVNRNAVWAWAEDISRAFESPKPSPSRQYAQRKPIEERSKQEESSDKTEKNEASVVDNKDASLSTAPSPEECSSPSPKETVEDSPLSPQAPSKGGFTDDTDEEGTMLFLVNVIQPQFNLQSEDARGRFLLAAATGRVLARSVHEVVHLSPEILEQTFKTEGDTLPGSIPEFTWKRREISVLLEHVQAHVAPTDVDPGAGLQWLPKISRGKATKPKRTGALLERIFMPCKMYFQYTRHKSETGDVKVKPLKELSFNSPNITATMTSRQFQVMLDVIGNLLFARLPKPQKNSFFYDSDEDEAANEDIDEVVPNGVEEVDLARIRLEQIERELKLMLDDLAMVAQENSLGNIPEAEISKSSKEGRLWMMSSGYGDLAFRLEDEVFKMRRARKLACCSLTKTLQGAARQRLMEKEKNKSPSFAMRISWAIGKVVWSMLSDEQTFAEAEINGMILNLDRDFHDVGVAKFTTKHFVVKNCLPHAKSNTVLSAWNPPPEWGRIAMLRVYAEQSPPKDGHSPFELFEVEIYPLKIYLTETMYRMMWDYFFPEEEKDSQRRQAWRASTNVSKRGKKTLSTASERLASNSIRDDDIVSKSLGSSVPTAPLGSHPNFLSQDISKIDIRLAAQLLEKHAKKSAHASKVEHQRVISYLDKTQDTSSLENVLFEALQTTTNTQSLSSSRNMYDGNVIDPDNVFQSTATAGNNMEISNNSNSSRESSRSHKLSKSLAEDKKSGKTIQEEKKESKLPPSNLQIQNIKICQVELIVTYEGSRFAISDVRLLMDTFTRTEFRGTWRKLFGRVKKHVIWGVLKSVTGMQGKKFKDKLQAHIPAEGGYPASGSNSSESEGSNDKFAISQFKKQGDRAGEGFVSSIRGLFNSQRKKAKALVHRTVQADGEDEVHKDWGDSETESTAYAKPSLSKAKRLLKKHTKKLHPSRHRGGMKTKESSQALPKGSSQSEGSSDESSSYEDVND